MSIRLLSRACVLAFALGAWCAAPSSAQDLDGLLGRVVSEVRLVSGGQAVRDAQLEGLIAVRAGEALRMDTVRETIVHAMGLGRYLDVRVSAEPDGDRVRVDIDLVPLSSVRQLVFRGDLGLTEAALRGAVVDRFGSTPARSRAPDIIRVLEDLLKDEGYLRAAVRLPAPASAGASADEMIIDIACGLRALVRSVSFRPDAGEATDELRLRLRVKAGDVYRRLDLRTQLDAARDAWRARKYLEARADALPPEESATGEAVDLTINVSRGPLVSVEFTGDPLPPKQLAELVPVAREASVDEDLLEDSRARIVAYLRGQGYGDARADFKRDSADGRLRIVFSVKHGPLYRVAGVRFEGAAFVPEPELRSLIRSAAGRAFVQSTLDADLLALVAAYRQRGFGTAACTSAVEPVPRARTAGEAPVVVIITVSEGPRTLVTDVKLAGSTVQADDVRRPVLGTKAGAPLFGPTVEADRELILDAYVNRGFRLARVDSAVTYSADRTGAAVIFTIREGPRILIDHVLIIGNVRVSEATIRKELVLEPGQPLGLNVVNESQRRLSALGLFRRVTISEVQQRDEHLRDVLVTVEESPATSLGYGVGVEFQKVETSEIGPRGFVELGRQNLWGHNRSINLFSRISFRRRTETVTSASSGETTDVVKTALEYRVFATYRAPKVWRWADLQVVAGIEQGSRTSFSFRHRSARVSLSHRIGSAWTVLGQYALQQNNIFDDQIAPADRPLIDRLFPQVRIGSVSASAVRNTRDDPFDPGRGTFLGLNGELALRPLGSEVGFAKTFLQGFLYRKLPTARRIVAAGAARVGLGTGFTRDAVLTDENGQPVVGSDGQPVIKHVRDLPASERFFAGGDTTVRGFLLDRVGRPDTFDSNGTPKGGHAVVILNGELRVALWKDLGVVGFIDAGNVFSTVNDVSLTDLRTGAGFGIRYKSPIGPLRIDFGFKLGTLQTFGTTHESRFALHISIGQAF